MKSEVNVFYADDTEEELKPKVFDYLVTMDESKKATVTVMADINSDKIECVSMTLTKDQWLEIVQGVQEVLDAWEEEDE